MTLRNIKDILNKCFVDSSGCSFAVKKAEIMTMKSHKKKAIMRNSFESNLTRH